jgi:hypothetical protein
LGLGIAIGEFWAGPWLHSGLGGARDGGARFTFWRSLFLYPPYSNDYENNNPILN